MGKSQFPATLSWQTTSPTIGFLPAPGPNQSVAGNSPSPQPPLAGALASTSTIYTNILGIAQVDNSGLEVTWSGTPTGTLQVMVSNSGVAFYPLTFNPALAQPAGSAGGYVIALEGVPFRYVFLQYTNSSGTGSILPVYTQNKANNR